jgi:hypothetical protein
MKEQNYHDVEAVSNSSLNWFEQSPYSFQKYLKGELEYDSSWGKQGTLIHMFLLEPDEFEKNYTHLDYETPRTEQQRNFCKQISNKVDPIEAYKGIYSSKGKSEDKIKQAVEELRIKFRPYLRYLNKSKEYEEVLSDSQWLLLNNIKTEVFMHTAATQLLEEEGLNEYPIYFDDPTTGIKCKALIDRLIIDKEKKEITLIDIKTCNTFKKFRDRVRDFNYHRQLAFYWRAIIAHLVSQGEDLTDYIHKTYIIAINTKDLVEVKVFEVPEDLLFEADDEINRLLLRLVWHFEEDKWLHTREYYNNNGIDQL